MNTKRISKFLSLVLRHRPELIQLQLDKQGWASVEELLEKVKTKGFELDYSTLQTIVEQNDKQRFKLSEDGTRIRANQGHSIAIDLALAPKEPPKVLYHGTSTRFLESIQQKGLLKMNRQHVHLSLDKKTAHKVGARHGKPVILLVDCKKMSDQGIPFYLAENGVWLTDYVAPGYLSILPN